MYRSATMHSVIDRWMDGQTDGWTVS